MPLPPEQRFKFFVFVIESPSPLDLYHRRSEGEIVRQAVELNVIKCAVKTAISRLAFEACLKIGLTEAMAENPGLIPILHISAHGNQFGIQLSDGYVMSWHELKDFLKPVNAALQGLLVLCMSSCEGYSGIRMAMHTDESDLPYFALIGCGSKPTWGETAVAYATFYHQMARGEHISEAVRAMCVASGNNLFFLEHAQESRRAYLEYMQTYDSAQAQSSMESIVSDECPTRRDELKGHSEISTDRGE